MSVRASPCPSVNRTTPRRFGPSVEFFAVRHPIQVKTMLCNGMRANTVPAASGMPTVAKTTLFRHSPAISVEGPGGAWSGFRHLGEAVSG